MKGSEETSASPHHGVHAHDHDAEEMKHNLSLDDGFYRAVYWEMAGWLGLAPGWRVLDAGCGTGGMTELLAAAVGPEGSVTGVDADGELVEACRSALGASASGDRVVVLEADLASLPFPDGSFDAVWCSRTLHHLPDQLAGMKEIRRVLKPGGLLALREDGLRPRVLPVDIGLGEPGLEDRLTVIYRKWFAGHVRWSEDQEVVPYHAGWTQMLQDGGFSDISSRTFMLDLLPPFSDAQREYVLHMLSRWLEVEDRRDMLAPEDEATLVKLLEPRSEHYVLRRPDLHYREGITVYTAQADG